MAGNPRRGFPGAVLGTAITVHAFFAYLKGELCARNKSHFKENVLIYGCFLTVIAVYLIKFSYAFKPLLEKVRGFFIGFFKALRVASRVGLKETFSAVQNKFPNIAGVGSFQYFIESHFLFSFVHKKFTFQNFSNNQTKFDYLKIL